MRVFQYVAVCCMIAGFFISSVTYSQVYINEILASNNAVYLDTEFNNYSDWIELYNGGSGTVDMSGYYLSDNILRPTKWKFPQNTLIHSGAYLIIWADDQNTGLHSNFKLSSSGEYIALYNKSLAIIDSLTFGQQTVDISYGRQTDGSSQWNFFAIPTPGQANNTHTQNNIATPPVFSPEPGFFNTAQSVVLSASSPSTIIRYTTDGTEPDETSSLYAAPIEVSFTMVIRAKTFGDDYLPSNTKSCTYFINEPDFSLPVISLSTTPDNLWDNTIGIYVQGTNGIPGNCLNYPVNWNQDWERPVSMEFYDTSATLQFQQDAGMKIYGGCTRAFDQKSLAIIARNDYGKNRINYRFFNDKSIESFKSIVLRNSGNDWGETLLRDAFMQEIVKDRMDIDYQAYQPAILYINGEYWGIQNIREKITEHYVSNNTGINSDLVNLLELNNEVVFGDNQHYTDLVNYLNSHNLSDDLFYDYVTTQIDIDEYMNYMITQIYMGNTDWPGRNIKFWRPVSDYGQYRWIMYDLDFGMGAAEEPSHNTLEFALEPNGPEWPNPPWSTLLFRKLIQNQGFVNAFSQRFAHHINSTFQPDRVLDILDSMALVIAPEMPGHILRWYNPANIEDWQYNLQEVRSFAEQRPAQIQQHIKNVFGHSGMVKLIIENHDTNTGYVLINQNIITDTLFTGDYFKDVPVSLYTSLIPGYDLDYWKVASYTQVENLLITRGATWKYLDDGTDQDTAWYKTLFNDSAWQSGPAQLGYGDDDEATSLSYGPNRDDKYITYYFRKIFYVNDTAAFDELRIRLMKDDGAVVYLNGREAVRSNMPDSDINYLTLAAATTGGDDEDVYNEYAIDTGLLNTGMNVVAVEVHQANETSSDISFDLELVSISSSMGSTVHINDYPLNLTMDEGKHIIPVFKQIDAFDSLVINEFMTENDNGIMDDHGQYEDWIEIYNAGSRSVNLGGLYVTDDINNLTLWQIPSTNRNLTMVHPGKFIVMWADGDTNQGPLHLGLKLDNDGEQIAISQMVDSEIVVIDSITFKAFSADLSFGSYPDGSTERMEFTTITPGATNKYSPVDVITQRGTDGFLIYPNPANEIVKIRFDRYNNSTPFHLCRIEFSSITGQIVLSRHIKSLFNNEIILNISGIPPGLYIVRLLTGNNIMTGKLYKK